MTDEADPREPHLAREPAFNAPWTMLVLIGLLIGSHGLRKLLGLGPEAFAFTSEDVAAGRWAGLVSYLFTHGGWAHVLLNSAAILAFAAPTARLLGGGARGALSFFAFFLVCGAISALGYAALLGQSEWARGGGGWGG